MSEVPTVGFFRNKLSCLEGSQKVTTFYEVIYDESVVANTQKTHAKSENTCKIKKHGTFPFCFKPFLTPEMVYNKMEMFSKDA